MYTSLQSLAGSRWIFLTLLLAALPARAQSLSPTELINVAGRQRMLSQRIVKDYAQLAQDVEYEESLRELHYSVDLFERQLQTLKDNVPAGKVQQTLHTIEGLWKPFRTLATGEVNKEGGRKLMISSEPLLLACQKSVLQLEDASKFPQARLVNVAGRQRMLSQRIAKDYMLLSWGLGGAAARQEMEQSQHEFEGAMAELKAAPENSPETRRALAEVERQWIVFRGSFQLQDKGSYVPLFVAMASDKVLALFDFITSMYASSSEASASGTLPNS